MAFASLNTGRTTSRVDSPGRLAAVTGTSVPRVSGIIRSNSYDNYRY